MPADPVRDAAVAVLLRVFERRIFIGVALDKTFRRKRFSVRGRRFLTQLVYGTVRHKTLCDHVLRTICTQPLENLPRPIHAVLRMAIFQALFCNQVTTPAMVHTSVDVAKKRSHAGIARLVNAVLRRAPADIADVALPDPAQDGAAYLTTLYSMPRWLVRAWIDEYGFDEAEALCAASNVEARPTLRVNMLKTNRETLAKQLNAAGYPVAAGPSAPEELTVTEGGVPIKAKLFQEGHFTIQDPASMLVAHLVEPQAGELVLDMCAAPGGKCTHLAQLADGGARIVAMDSAPYRLDRIQENIARLETPGISLVTGDGTRPPFNAVFDRVLVDAPCSGIGTLRRHHDLKWNSSPEAVARLAKIQADLLRSARRLCKNGGCIVYSVCTFTPEETEAVTWAVLDEGGLTPEDGPEWLHPWKTATGQYRTLPLEGALDGFFLMRFRKQS